MGLIDNLSKTINPEDANNTLQAGSGKGLNDLPDQLLGSVINNIIMPLGGVVAVVSLVYGGYLYITAGQDPEKAQKGKRVIIYSVIAIVILVLSYVIYNTVLNCVSDTLGGNFLCPNR